jgi:hypothetical protein
MGRGRTDGGCQVKEISQGLNRVRKKGKTTDEFAEKHTSGAKAPLIPWLYCRG